MIYLDNAGTTQVLPEILEIYNAYQNENFFNPSAPYHPALEIGNRIKTARMEIKSALKAPNGEILFTSSGTESNNLVLFGTKKSKNARIIVSESEHPSVYNAALELKQRGYDVVFCEVDSSGRVIEEKFREYVTPETDLISIMHVNNETGCVNDIKKLCGIAKERNGNVLFHSDGVQAVGKVKVNLGDLGVDMYTISGHKIHSVKGTAGLYIKNGIRIKPILFGGGQEFGIRSSTENVGGILAMEYAIKEAIKAQKERENESAELFSYTKTELEKLGFFAVESAEQSPYVLCFAMPKIKGEVMLHSLEKYGIYVGIGSACSSRKSSKKLPKMLRLTSEYENGVIRVSFSRFTVKNDIDYFIEQLKKEYLVLIKYIN